MKALLVVGTRPQIIKASVLLEALVNSGFEVVLVHTGQHYDTNLSDVFFQELKFQLPNYNLEVGSNNYKNQLSVGIQKLAEIIDIEAPKVLITIGDSNPALLGSLGALLKGIKLVHGEAGLRSGNIGEVEERNRIIVDTVSDYLFCSTPENLSNLVKENTKGIINLTGDLLKDVWVKYSPYLAKNRPTKFTLLPENFCLFTIHRNNNAYNPKRLKAITDMITHHWKIPTIWTCHPGVKNELISLGLWENLLQTNNLFLSPPVSYFELRWLQENCEIVATDSVGVQVEAYLARKPSVEVVLIYINQNSHV